MKNLIYILLLFAWFPAFAKPQLVTRSEGTNGDFTARILAPAEETKLPYDQSVPMTVELRFPSDASFQSHDLDFAELPCFDCDAAPLPEPLPGEDGHQALQLKYLLEPLQPPYEIPAVTVTFKDRQGNDVTATTEPFTLTIAEAELSAEVADDALAPIAPPGMDRQSLLRLLAWCGGGLLVAILLGGSLWRTLRNRHHAAAPLTPYEIAQRDLAALLAEKLPEAGEYKRFCQRISTILRDYLENRFGVKAPRLTTEEFLQLLATTPELVREHRDLLQKFLTACDLVKFAGDVPDVPEITQITTACRTFLDTTQPRENAPDNSSNSLSSNK